MGEKSYKYFTGYFYDNHKFKPLNIILPKTNAYIKSYHGQIKWMDFLIEDDDLLEKSNTIWDKVCADIKKEFDSEPSEPVYNKEYLKTKIKSHSNKVTDFYDKKILKETPNHTCLAVISLDSALKKDDNYYPQLPLKECKYIEKKVVRHINYNLSDFSSSNESDEGYLSVNDFWESCLEKVYFENVFFWESNFEHVFWETNFENVFSKRAILKYFVENNSENVFFRMYFWGSNCERV